MYQTTIPLSCPVESIDESRRGRVDYSYRLDALSALKDDPARFGWLCDHKAMTAGGKSAWKPSILTELARLGDPDRDTHVRRSNLRAETQGPRRDRDERARLGRGPAASADDLADVIGDVINKYLAHRDGERADDVAMIFDALDLVRARLNQR